jgi:hypothetical protein
MTSTSDPIIEAAKRELAELDAKRQEIETFLAGYERYRAMIVGLTPSSLTATVPPDAKPAKGDAVMSAVCQLLIERGDALTLAAIFDGLVERGVFIGGKHPKQNLSQKLSAHPELKSYGKRGWYFADTLPPCMQPVRSLSSDDGPEYEEDPIAVATRSLQWNGAASAN